MTSKISNDKTLQSNPNGPIVVWFGRQAPTCKEGNWIRAMHGKGWLTLFRLYGPLQSWLDQDWTPDGIIRV